MTDRAPILTRQRWACLIALRDSPDLMDREFRAHELVMKGRQGHPFPASGATLDSLRKAGWVERVTVGDTGEGMPFRTGGPASAWRVTEAGRRAVEACPDTFPGQPVYEGRGE